MPRTIKIAIVDDHTLFRKGLMSMVLSFSSHYSIFLEAENGIDFLNKLNPADLPDIIIMDMSMPKMDGYELTKELRATYPQIPVMVVSMINQENSIIRMLRLGVKGYVSKDIEPEELHKAIENILADQYHYTDFITGKLVQTINHTNTRFEHSNSTLSERELTFLKFASTEYTYQQIADKMFLSIKTIDGYRASLFEKLNVKSRTGLVLYGIKNGLISVN